MGFFFWDSPNSSRGTTTKLDLQATGLRNSICRNILLRTQVKDATLKPGVSQRKINPILQIRQVPPVGPVSMFIYYILGVY